MGKPFFISNCTGSALKKISHDIITKLNLVWPIINHALCTLVLNYTSFQGHRHSIGNPGKSEVLPRFGSYRSKHFSFKWSYRTTITWWRPWQYYKMRVLLWSNDDGTSRCIWSPDKLRFYIIIRRFIGEWENVDKNWSVLPHHLSKEGISIK